MESLSPTNRVAASTAHPAHQLIFPATITGVAKPYPLIQSRDAPTVDIDTDQDCTDPPDIGDCSVSQTPDSEGFYPDEVLPCGVYPARYRWIADAGALSSEGCGYRKNEMDEWVPWRQANYAVNVAHSVQDAKLDYPYVKPGTPVIMYYTRLSNMADYSGGIGWGYAFIHYMDPPGTQTCPPDNPQAAQGCCIITTSPTTRTLLCSTEEQCDAFEGGTITSEFLGFGINCPPPIPGDSGGGNICEGGPGGGIIPAGLPAAWVPPIGQQEFQKSVRLVTPWHKLAGEESTQL